jgi:hypothetical protein
MQTLIVTLLKSNQFQADCGKVKKELPNRHASNAAIAIFLSFCYNRKPVGEIGFSSVGKCELQCILNDSKFLYRFRRRKGN